MKTSVTKLVDVILQRIQEQPGLRVSEKGLRTWLTEEGYPKADIDAAMQAVGPRFLGPVGFPRPKVNGVRQLAAHEAFRLSAEARDALARLEMYDLIDPAEREFILERFDQFEGEIGLTELDYLVSWVVSSRDYEHQQTVFNMLEGRRETFH